MEQIRLLLVDDEPAVRRGLRMRLELEADVEVVGEAGDGRAALEAVRELSPNVVLMDVEMPVLDGIAAASEMQVSAPGTAVVMISIHDDPGTVGRAQAAGVTAFVPKHRIDRGLMEAIRRAAGIQKEEA
jgi:DNA-binding NarL/FixJ family response regulator